VSLVFGLLMHDCTMFTARYIFTKLELTPKLFSLSYAQVRAGGESFRSDFGDNGENGFKINKLCARRHNMPPPPAS